MLQLREDIQRLQGRAALGHGRFGVVWAMTGEGVEREFAVVDDAIREYTREPMLV